jgi:hypothetical protein
MLGRIRFMEILEAIDALDDMVHGAKQRPFRGPSQARVDRTAFTAAVARLRAAIASNLPDVVAPQVAEPISHLERMGAEASVKGDRLMLDVEAVYDELDEARRLAAEDLRRQLRAQR